MGPLVGGEAPERRPRGGNHGHALLPALPLEGSAPGAAAPRAPRRSLDERGRHLRKRYRKTQKRRNKGRARKAAYKSFHTLACVWCVRWRTSPGRNVASRNLEGSCAFGRASLSPWA